MIKYILMAIPLAVLVIGCSYKSTYTIDETDKNEFEQFRGLKDIFSPDEKIQNTKISDIVVYYVHGMGVHPSNEKETLDFFHNVAREMGFSERAINGPHDLKVDDETIGDMTLVTYRGKQQDFVLVSLSWSQTTEKVEEILNNTSNPFGDRIAWGNKKLKLAMNEGFADAVLYLNPDYRQLMHAAIKKGVEKAYALKPKLQGSKNVLVSTSLGSKVVFDIMKSHYGIKMKKPAYDDFFDNLEQVYMTSNQIPLLDFSDTSPSYESTSDKKSYTEKEKLLNIAKSLRTIDKKQSSTLLKMSQELEKRRKRTLPIIAFSDPNDALSYYINTRKVGIIKFTNVTISHAKWWWFGVLANPLKAHGGLKEVKHGYKTLVHGSSYLQDKFKKYERIPLKKNSSSKD